MRVMISPFEFREGNAVCLASLTLYRFDMYDLGAVAPWDTMVQTLHKHKERTLHSLTGRKKT